MKQTVEKARPETNEIQKPKTEPVVKEKVAPPTTTTAQEEEKRERKRKAALERKRLRRLKFMLAISIAVYHVAIIAYHNHRHERLFAMKLYPELLLKGHHLPIIKHAMRFLGTILALYYMAIYNYKTTRMSTATTIMLGLTVLFWIARLLVLQPAYFVASHGSVEPIDIIMLFGTIGVMISIILLWGGPEVLLLNEADKERLLNMLQQNFEKTVNEAEVTQTEEDKAIQSQYEELLVEIDKDMEEEDTKKKKKKREKKKKKPE